MLVSIEIREKFVLRRAGAFLMRFSCCQYTEF